MSLVLLPPLSITTAVTAVVTTGVKIPTNTRSVSILGKFTYVASAATSATFYVQTSLDDGTTWVDVACFSYTTASANSVANLSSLTPVTTIYTPTDGTLANNTVKDGIIGEVWRVKYTTVGTYGAGTTMEIRVNEISSGRP